MPAHLKKSLFKFVTPFAIFLLSAFMTLACSTGTVYSGSGLVSSVGGATFIQGAQQFWVSSSKPTLSGITTASASVTGTVGAEAVSATADASGNWSWTPTTELSGDNQVTITSGSTTVSFTLTIGELPESIASASASTLAPAGITTPTTLIFAGGTTFVMLGLFGIIRSRRSSI